MRTIPWRHDSTSVASPDAVTSHTCGGGGRGGRGINALKTLIDLEGN